MHLILALLMLQLGNASYFCDELLVDEETSMPARYELIPLINRGNFTKMES